MHIMDVQRLNKSVEDQYGAAQKYYQILSVLNDLHLSEGEIQLIAFAAIKGNITDSEIRKEFCEKYDTTIATINNMIWRLKKKALFHKKGRTLFVNPLITKLDFNKDLTLIIFIKNSNSSNSSNTNNSNIL